MSETAATWRYTVAMTVPALAAEMLNPSWRDADRPLIQFIMDWRRFPGQRRQVLAEAPPADTDEVIAAKMATVVHALCERDGLEAPEWVHQHRLVPAIGLFGVHLHTPMEGASNSGPRGCALSTASGSAQTCSTRRQCPSSAPLNSMSSGCASCSPNSTPNSTAQTSPSECSWRAAPPWPSAGATAPPMTWISSVATSRRTSGTL